VIFVLLQVFFSGAAAVLLRKETGARVALTLALAVGMVFVQCAVFFVGCTVMVFTQ
jgi:ascorbate-specific PTS system EIIC-type component UlaA